MRRVLFTAFLSLTAFSVLGGNFLHVTAPTVAGEIGEFDTRPNAGRGNFSLAPVGATRLSGEPVAGMQPIAPLRLAEEATAGDHSLMQGDPAYGPIEVREESTDIARNAPGSEALFLSTWAEVPMAAAHYLGFANDVSTLAPTGQASRSAIDVERSSDAHTKWPYFIKALAELPDAIFTSQSFEPAPEMPKAPAPEAVALNDHDSRTNAQLIRTDGRTAAVELERMNAGMPADHVNAVSDVPSARGAPSQGPEA